MGNPVYTMESANLFCGASPTDSDASNHLILTELKLPGLDEQYVDHRAGGAPVAIEIDVFVAKLECTFILMGWTPQVEVLVKSWGATQNSFTAYGNIRDRSSGNALQAIARMTGRLARSDPANWRRGDVQHWNYMIKGIIHYELSLAGNDIYYWDFLNNTLLIGGVDVNADTNANLVTGVVATAGNQANTSTATAG